ncbi:MAG: hypothetical protein KAG61_09805 [Bacteriovoracaceae bacterium]|nr:hypothetical protein [Bacteriovoracaceae bacterium]
MLLYLATTEHEKRIMDDRLKRCKLPLSSRSLPIYQMSKLPLELRRKHINSVMSELGDTERAIISSILKKKKKVVHEKKLINAFNHFVESFDEKLSKGKRYRLRKSIEMISTRSSSNSILTDLLELLLALDMNNQAWAKHTLTRLLKKDFSRIVFNINERYFTSKTELKRFENNIRRAIIHISDKLEHKMFSLLAINYFASFYQSDNMGRLLQNLGSKWSLSEVRKYADKKIYGQHFFIPWYYILKGKTIEQELESYVRKFLTPELIRKLGVDVIPIFLHHLPKGEEKRRALLDVIIRSYKLSDYYSRYVIIQALKSEVIRKKLTKIPPKYLGATFQLERQFFHDALDVGGLRNLSLFKLSGLGEENIELLWWLVL